MEEQVNHHEFFRNHSVLMQVLKWRVDHFNPGDCGSSLEPITILMIGDSVDRNALTDWCSITGGISCEGHISADNQFSPNRTTSWSTTWLPNGCPNMTNDEDVSNLSMCYNRNINVNIGFYFNRLGVSSRFHCLEKYNYGCKINPYGDVHLFLQHMLLPAVHEIMWYLNNDSLPVASSVKRLDGLMFQSSFWELAGIWECNKTQFISDFRVNKSHAAIITSFTDKFALNAGVIIDRLKIALRPHWFGWRTSSILPIKMDSWYDIPGHHILDALNMKMNNVAIHQKQLEVIDFRNFHNVGSLRDPVPDHPNVQSSIDLMDCVIARVVTRKHGHLPNI